MTYVPTKLEREIVIHEIITIHYFEYMKDFIFLGETHDFWEFLYVDKGQVLVQADKTHYQMAVGDIVFHKPNEFHSIHSIGEKPPNLIAISFKSESDALKFYYNRCLTLNKQERMLLSHIIAEARQTFLTPLNIPTVEQVIINPDAPFGSQQLILNYLELLLIEMIKNRVTSTMSQSYYGTLVSAKSASDSERLETVLQYMEDHIYEQLSVKDICNASSISRSALQALFKREKGCGTIEHFNHMKLEHAKEIIRHGTMNFTEISCLFSYSSLQYFSKCFKKATGMSPLEYSSSVKGITNRVNKKVLS